jgi:hypothetical protein
MNAAFTFIVGLTLTGLFPAIAVAGVTPVSIFLSPLLGAITAGVAVELELTLGGSMLCWFVVGAVLLNLAALALLLRRKCLPTWEIHGRAVVTLIVLFVVLAVPLTGLRAHEVGYDGSITWTTHALLISAGHNVLVPGLQNPAYLASNSDYPPLVPAVSALGFSFAGRTVLILGAELTALLNAAAVGVIGVGITLICRPSVRRDYVLSVVFAAIICLGAFSVGGDYVRVGNYGVDGYADLLWAAAAVAAVLWGLVLPRGRSALLVAWCCAIVASLTKNEGLVTAIVIMLLIAVRYQQPTLHRRDAVATAMSFGKVLGLWIAPAFLGLVWITQMHFLHVQNYFFGTRQAETLGTRTSATVHAMGNSEDVFFVALLILAIGCIWFRNSRRLAELGHPLWLWTAWAAGNVVIAATYVFGSLEIHTWLMTSVDRTTIYGKLLLLVEIAIWAIIVGKELMDTYLSDLRPTTTQEDAIKFSLPDAQEIRRR